MLGRKLGLTCDSLQSRRGRPRVRRDGHLRRRRSFRPLLGVAGRGRREFRRRDELHLRHPSRSASSALFTLVWPWSAAAAVTPPGSPGRPRRRTSSGRTACSSRASRRRRAMRPPPGSPASTSVPVAPPGRSSTRSSASAGRARSPNFVGSAGYLDTMQIEGGCEGDSVAECHLPSQNPAGGLTRAPFAAKSNIIDASCPTAASRRCWPLSSSASPRLCSPEEAMVLDASGGAINRVAPDATAYVHRRARRHPPVQRQLDRSPHRQAGRGEPCVDQRRLVESMQPFVSRAGPTSNYAEVRISWAGSRPIPAPTSPLKEVKSPSTTPGCVQIPQSVPPA